MQSVDSFVKHEQELLKMSSEPKNEEEIITPRHDTEVAN